MNERLLPIHSYNVWSFSRLSSPLLPTPSSLSPGQCGWYSLTSSTLAVVLNVISERQCQSVTSASCFPTPVFPSYTRVVSWGLSMNIDPPLELTYPPANPRHNSLPLENKQLSPFTVVPCFLSSSIRYSQYYYARLLIVGNWFTWLARSTLCVSS